jgi:hypothetical protein
MGERDDNKPVGSKEEENIQECDQHEEAIPSYICVLLCFT